MDQELDNWENEGGSSVNLSKDTDHNLNDILNNCYGQLEFKLSAECIDLTKEEWARLINCKCGKEKIEEYIRIGINYFSVDIKTEEAMAAVRVRFYKEKMLEEDIIGRMRLMDFNRYFTASPK